jgi:hypothetical protein
MMKKMAMGGGKRESRNSEKKGNFKNKSQLIKRVDILN